MINVKMRQSSLHLTRWLVLASLVSAGLGWSAEPQAGGSADLGKLFADPGIQAALRYVEENEATVLEDQVELCQVPAPPFKEQARALVLKRKFEGLGLTEVAIDGLGNVIGLRPGKAPHPSLVLSAHLDTVFPEGTDVQVKREGNVLKGPGIGDDCRGLAVMLGVLRALKNTSIVTEGPVTFVGTLGEEGLGDLRGVKYLFSQSLKGRIDRFVSIDGTGFGITHRAVGSHRYRVTYRGPGGHSYGDFGVANPVHALGRAIARIGDIEVPSQPRTTFAVGRVGGGTSVNSIATDSWMEMDLRSSDQQALEALDARFRAAVGQALAEENARWNNRGRLTVEIADVGNRPPGGQSQGAPIVVAAVAATKSLGLPIELTEGSTDANVPMNLGIPAICIDGGGRGQGAHSPTESFDATDSWKGTQRALLVTVALTRP